MYLYSCTFFSWSNVSGNKKPCRRPFPPAQPGVYVFLMVPTVPRYYGKWPSTWCFDLQYVDVDGKCSSIKLIRQKAHKCAQPRATSLAKSGQLSLPYSLSQQKQQSLFFLSWSCIISLSINISTLTFFLIKCIIPLLLRCREDVTAHLSQHNPSIPRRTSPHAFSNPIPLSLSHCRVTAGC